MQHKHIILLKNKIIVLFKLNSFELNLIIKFEEQLYGDLKFWSYILYLDKITYFS